MRTVAILVPSFRPEIFFNRLLPVLQKEISIVQQSQLYVFEIFVLIPEHVDLSIFDYGSLNVSMHILRTKESGFSIPRNLLWNSAQNFDINVFVDDDQIPITNWLQELVNGIESHPNYAVYFGDIFFRVPENSPKKSFSKLLPADRLGSGREVISLNHGIGNSAILRNSLPSITDPFSLDFNKGGEDTDFFLRLKEMGYRFYEQFGCAVIEEWDISRLQINELTNRSKRGIIAYYEIRQKYIHNNLGGPFDSIKVYARIFWMLLVSPLFLCVFVINALNPFEVLRIQIGFYLTKIYHVSTIPWKVKLMQVTGRSKI